MGALRNRALSFRHAGRGVAVLARQPNAIIHLCAAVAVVAVAAWLRVSARDWIVLTLCIALVLVTEALNTALERVVDLASPDWHPLARDAKDVAAGAVLIAALGAGVAGLIVFWPYVAGGGPSAALAVTARP